MSAEKTLNLTPSPRVLRMLGQIDFKPWQCIAELVDNSVDAFLSEGGRSLGIVYPQVNVELSGQQEIKHGTATIKVSDNGPGMSPEDLENAVRAGYSSNNPVDKLGLFGMGFNVATARLGNRTEVWTTRMNDDRWSGVRIDFDEMEKHGSFAVPELSRYKTAAEADVHGTEVIVSKLDRDRALYLRSGGGLRSTKDKLSRVYNQIMRELDLKVVILGSALESREFCVWDKKRFVETKGELGRIPAQIPVRKDFGQRLYCNDCWVWLLDDESVCPVCESSDRLRLRDRQVGGWLGIQRFFDQQDYGIDLVRNGRVIEERSKVFFSWVNPDTGQEVPEYPIEQQHWGGRIVGELSLDFVPLASHQKDAFDKTSAEWKLAVEAVRGSGPILQKARKQLSLPERENSPLARLHSGYRRGSPPGLRTLVPGDATGRGINVEPQRWAAEFWQGNPDYQTDEKWFEAVLIAEEARTKGKGASVPDDLGGGDLFEDPSADGEESPPDDGGAPPDPYQQVEDPSLSGLFELTEVPGGPRLEVSAERVVSGHLAGNAAFAFAVAGSRVAFAYDLSHPMFAQSTMEPVDCLVNELAYQILQRSNTSQQEWPLTRIGAELRARYFSWSLDTFDYARTQSQALLSELADFYADALGDSAPVTDVLTSEHIDALRKTVAQVDHAGDDRVADIIAAGEFPRYLGARYAKDWVEMWPELALDGRFLSVAYLQVAEAFRPESFAIVLNALTDIAWVANPDGPRAMGEEWHARLGRAISSLRLVQAWRA